MLGEAISKKVLYKQKTSKRTKTMEYHCSCSYEGSAITSTFLQSIEDDNKQKAL